MPWKGAPSLWSKHVRVLVKDYDRMALADVRKAEHGDAHEGSITEHEEQSCKTKRDQQPDDCTLATVGAKWI